MNPTYKYEFWFEGPHRLRMACESNAETMRQHFEQARGKGAIIHLDSMLVFDPCKVLYYSYHGEGKW